MIFSSAFVRSLRLLVDGLRTAPGDYLDGEDAGIFQGMRPGFVVVVLLPLLVAAVTVWSRVR